MKKIYSYQKPTDESLILITKLREAFSQLDDLITTVCPTSREKSLALTKLEEVSMWGVKAVVHNQTGEQK